jgi:hypothetical protein
MVNNNPGNIRLILKVDGSLPSPFVGEVRPGDIKPGSRFGMRRFATIADGTRALYKVLNNEYLGRGLNTIAKIFPVYAPAGDNNHPDKYINFVEGATGINRNKILSQSDLIPLVKAITREEKGETLPNGTAENVYRNLNNANYFTQNPLPYKAPAGKAPGTNHFAWLNDRKKRIEVLTLAGITATGIYIMYKNGKLQKAVAYSKARAIGRR